MLYFNSDKFDFWKIYNSIKCFYPIGIPKGENGIYYSYPGVKELEAIVVENIHDNHNFKTRWEVFCTGIQEEVGKPVIGTTYGQSPSFSAFLQLDTYTLDNVTKTKELHFFVSLVGPYYSVIGQENVAIEVGEKIFRSTNYLLISPENEFSATFELLCDKIIKRFNGYRFVPFAICKQTIQGLYVHYGEGNLNAIFNALFNDHIDLGTPTMGNDYFKAENWVKDDYTGDSNHWTVLPPK